MAANSKIEWTDHTFNPLRGCTKVAEGCKHCYADALSKRNPGTLGIWGPGGTRVVASEAMWREPLKWNREAERNGVRARVFCASLADVFEEWLGPIVESRGIPLCVNAVGHWYPEGVPSELPNADDWGQRELTLDDVRRRLFRLIDATPHLDWLLLTKRPENIRRMWPEVEWSSKRGSKDRRSNVWLGTSVEDQATADARIPELFKCRDLAPVLFLSCEPLLGPVNLTEAGAMMATTCRCESPWRTRVCRNPGCYGMAVGAIDWVIAGGEGGPQARPMHPDWVRGLRDQCLTAGVPYFFKQWGEYSPDEPANAKFQDMRLSRDGSDVTFLPGLWDDADATLYRIGKKAAGRLLDGREWNELPKTGEQL